MATIKVSQIVSVNLKNYQLICQNYILSKHSKRCYDIIIIVCLQFTIHSYTAIQKIHDDDMTLLFHPAV